MSEIETVTLSRKTYDDMVYKINQSRLAETYKTCGASGVVLIETKSINVLGIQTSSMYVFRDFKNIENEVINSLSLEPAFKENDGGSEQFYFEDGNWIICDEQKIDSLWFEWVISSTADKIKDDEGFYVFGYSIPIDA